jgi:hypothetical protein
LLLITSTISYLQAKQEQLASYKVRLTWLAQSFLDASIQAETKRRILQARVRGLRAAMIIILAGLSAVVLYLYFVSK